MRTLVTARQAVADAREHLAAAERADIAAYNAALRDGWSTEELRAIGITEPEKKTRTRTTSPPESPAPSAPIVTRDTVASRPLRGPLPRHPGARAPLRSFLPTLR